VRAELNDALAALSSLLSRPLEGAEKPFATCVEMDRVLGGLQASVGVLGSQIAPVDVQQIAVRQFWKSQRLETLRDSRLVCFGVTLPHIPGGPCVLEDSTRFGTLLSILDNRWLGEPKKYRRCYLGLVANYFSYDPNDSKTPPEGKENWIGLRQYLSDRADNVVDGSFAPDWAKCVVDSPHLFGSAPCEPYGSLVLRGEMETVTRVRSAFSIDDSSWFARELVVAQVAAAITNSDRSFAEVLPRLLTLLADNIIVRDRGLVMLLDRYSKSLQHRGSNSCGTVLFNGGVTHG
jgi:hypothetical protein